MVGNPLIQTSAMHIGKVFLFFIFILSTRFGNTQALPLKRKVDSLVNVEMDRQRIPGLSLVVVRDGKMDLIKGYGLANLEHQVRVKSETIFQSGSVGKQFTAFAILLLVEEGKVKLQDPLTRFFPDAPASWNSITVQHLLTHTAGFGEYGPEFNYQAHYTEDSLYRIIKSLPLQFKAGERSEYSNPGYVMLGLIISKVTGQFYGDYLKRKIFEPLGMKTARIISESDIVPNRAAGYRLEDGSIKNQEWVSPSINTTADGSMYVSALDMARWEADLNGRKLLQPETFELIWTPVKLADGSSFPYGFGWWIDSLQGKRIVGHNGTWQGFESTIKRYPDKKLAVIVMANLRRANTDRIATRILQLYQPELRSPVLAPIRDNEPKIIALVEAFVHQLTNNQLKPDLFTPEFGDRFIPRANRASEHLKSMGKFLGLQLLDRKDLGDGSRMHHYRLVFIKDKEELLLTITKDYKIAAIEGRE